MPVTTRAKTRKNQSDLTRNTLFSKSTTMPQETAKTDAADTGFMSASGQVWWNTITAIGVILGFRSNPANNIVEYWSDIAIHAANALMLGQKRISNPTFYLLLAFNFYRLIDAGLKAASHTSLCQGIDHCELPTDIPTFLNGVDGLINHPLAINALFELWEASKADEQPEEDEDPVMAHRL